MPTESRAAPRPQQGQLAFAPDERGGRWQRHGRGRERALLRERLDAALAGRGGLA